MYFKDLLRFRQAWLGLALLWIVLFHLPLDLGALNPPKLVGYGGVDICFFASGIGCFYSLNADSNIGNFMKRRLRRLAPTYIVFIVIWLSYQYVTGNFNFQMAIGNLFALQNFTGLGYDFNWYISAIFLFYILAPYFVAIVKQASPVQKVMFLLFLIACSIPFWNANTYIITITRLPIFYIGMLFADMCKKDMKITSMHVVCLVAGFILGVVALGAVYFLLPQYRWSHGLYWYPFIVITPPLCIALSYILMRIERIKVIKPIVSFFLLCGDYSFEIYLVHIFLISCISTVISAFDLSRFSYLIWTAGSILLFVGCFILRRFTTLVSGLFHKYHNGNN